MAKYNINDEVYWNDPDDGACSGTYRVIDINEPLFGPPDSVIYKIRSEDGSETEAFEWELN